jgi:hypothetical protein
MRDLDEEPLIEVQRNVADALRQVFPWSSPPFVFQAPTGPILDASVGERRQITVTLFYGQPSVLLVWYGISFGPQVEIIEETVLPTDAIAGWLSAMRSEWNRATHRTTPEGRVLTVQGIKLTKIGRPNPFQPTTLELNQNKSVCLHQQLDAQWIWLQWGNPTLEDGRVFGSLIEAVDTFVTLRSTKSDKVENSP